MRKDVIKSLFAIKQSEIPFDVIERDTKLPIDRKKIITIPGVRRCGKSTLMEIAINTLVEKGVPKEYILWLGFDDERLRSMTSEELMMSLLHIWKCIPIYLLKMYICSLMKSNSSRIGNILYCEFTKLTAKISMYAVAMQQCSQRN